MFKVIAKAMNAKQITSKRGRWAYPWQVVEMIGHGSGKSLLSTPQRLREMACEGLLERDYLDETRVKAFTLTEKGVKFAKSK